MTIYVIVFGNFGGRQKMGNARTATVAWSVRAAATDGAPVPPSVGFGFYRFWLHVMPKRQTEALSNEGEKPN